MRATLFLTSLLMIACGSAAGGTDAASVSTDSGSSTVSGSCTMSAAYTCVDYVASGAALDAYRSSCTTGGSTWSDGACTHAMSVGGCAYAASASSGQGTVWTYNGGPYADAADARRGCEMGTPPGTYVAP